VKEPSKNRDIWVPVLFVFLHIFAFGFGSVLRKIWVLVWVVVVELLGFYLISSIK